MTDQKDHGAELMELFIAELKRRLKENPEEMVAAEFSVIRQLLSDNSITLAHVQRGNFGQFAKSVAEDFPFAGEDNDPTPTPPSTMN